MAPPSNETIAVQPYVEVQRTASGPTPSILPLTPGITLTCELRALPRGKMKTFGRSGKAAGRSIERTTIFAILRSLMNASEHAESVSAFTANGGAHGTLRGCARSMSHTHLHARHLACHGGGAFACQRVDLKIILGQIDADPDKLFHGRSPSLWRSYDHALAL